MSDIQARGWQFPREQWDGDEEGFRYRHNFSYGHWRREATFNTHTRTRRWQRRLRRKFKRPNLPATKICYCCLRHLFRARFAPDQWHNNESEQGSPPTRDRRCLACADKGCPPAPVQLWRPALAPRELHLADHVKCGSHEGLVVKVGRTEDAVEIVTVKEKRFAVVTLRALREMAGRRRLFGGQHKVEVVTYNDATNWLRPWPLNQNMGTDYAVLRPEQSVALALQLTKVKDEHQWSGRNLALFCRCGKFTRDLHTTQSTATAAVEGGTTLLGMLVSAVRRVLVLLRAPLPQEMLSEMLEETLGSHSHRLRCEQTWGGIASAIVVLLQLILRSVQLVHKRITMKEFMLAVLHDVLSTGLGGVLGGLAAAIPVPGVNVVLAVVANAIGRAIVDNIFRWLGWTEPQERHKAAEFAQLLGPGHPLLSESMVTGQQLHDALLQRLDAAVEKRASENTLCAIPPPLKCADNYTFEVHIFEHERRHLPGRWGTNFFSSSRGHFTLVGTGQKLGSTIEEAEASILREYPDYEWDD